MRIPKAHGIGAALLVTAAAIACSARDPDVGTAEHQHMSDSAMAAMPVSIPDGALITEADVRFMQGMIAHHAQAIHMTNLAKSRGADSRLLKLSTKIDLSQTAEIDIMQSWLAGNNQYVPDTSSHRTMLMPGMLTKEQLEQLEAAKGKEFDRLFLELMIQHHRGALKMVADLLATPRAAQDVDVSVFAADVELVQTAEIGIMQEILADL